MNRDFSLQKQGVKFKLMETFEDDWMYENNLARFYARYQEADTILKQKEREQNLVCNWKVIHMKK